MLTKIIAFSLALIPFYCWLGWDEGIRTPKETASIISLALIIIVGFSTPIKKAFNKWFFVFFGWCVLTLFLSNYLIPVYLQNGIVSLPSNLIAFKSLLYTLLAIISIQAIYSAQVDLKLISKTISIVMLVMCGYCLLQLLGLDEWFRIADPGTGWTGGSIWDNLITNTVNPINFGHFSRRIVGTLGNPSILGIFLSLCLPFSLSLKNKLGYVSAICSIIMIFLTLSLTAIISCILSILFILFFKNQRLAVILFIILAIAGVSVLQIPQVKFMINPTGRIEMLKESFNLINKKAITGYGLGSFQYLIGQNPEIVRRLHNENWREMHFEYGQAWFETGLVGLILLLMGIFAIGNGFIKNIREETVYLMASFLVFLLVCVTYFPMRISPLSYYGVIILGLLTNKIGDVK